MPYYSVLYRIFPRKFIEDVGTDYDNVYYFESGNKLDDAGIKYALEYYLEYNKESYTELIIKESKEITKQEYIGSTQYH